MGTRTAKQKKAALANLKKADAAMAARRININCRVCEVSMSVTKHAIKRGRKYCSPECRKKGTLLRNAKNRDQELIERFNDNYMPVTESGCWIWMLDCDQNGYGKISIKNKAYYAHRVSWELHNNSIPKGMFVCHKCDNPSCVNPDHLFLGTQSDNMQDMKSKGRDNYVNGENHKFAKLREKDVRKILISNKTNNELAKQYDISSSQICLIRRRGSWKHVET